MAAGAAMACSSVSVVVSSLLLKRWMRPAWMVEGGVKPPNLSLKEKVFSVFEVLGRSQRRPRGEETAGYVALRDMEADDAV